MIQSPGSLPDHPSPVAKSEGMASGKDLKTDNTENKAD